MSGLIGLIFLSVRHASIIGDQGTRQRLEKMPFWAKRIREMIHRNDIRSGPASMRENRVRKALTKSIRLLVSTYGADRNKTEKHGSPEPFTYGQRRAVARVEQYSWHVEAQKA